MARESFKPGPADGASVMNVPTDGLPDKVSIDLDNKDPNAFEIVEVDDTPDADKGKPTKWNGVSAAEEEDLRDVSSKVQKRINRLRAETETERRAREAVERERDAAVELARTAQEENQRLRTTLEGNTRVTAEAMIAERKTRLADAQKRLERAHADGDSAGIASATSDLTAAQSELTQIQSRMPAAPKPGDPQRQAQPAQAQPQRQQPQLNPKVQQWIGRNPWFNKDTARTNAALSIHYALAGEGIGPDSQEYTREVDKRLKAVYPDHQPMEYVDDDGGDGNPRPRRTNTVEPGGRDNDVRQPANPRRVELSASELAIAKWLRISPQQYAAEKVKREQRMGGAQ